MARSVFYRNIWPAAAVGKSPTSDPGMCVCKQNNVQSVKQTLTADRMSVEWEEFIHCAYLQYKATADPASAPTSFCRTGGVIINCCKTRVLPELNHLWLLTEDTPRKMWWYSLPRWKGQTSSNTCSEKNNKNFIVWLEDFVRVKRLLLPFLFAFLYSCRLVVSQLVALVSHTVKK